MKNEGHTGHGWKRRRAFLLFSRPDESGRMVKQARITCATCGASYHHLRRGTMDSAEYFTRRGWEVGNNEKHDRCPACIENAKGKVVNMADHKKAESAAPAEGERTMTRDEGRILSRTIEDHWDEAGGCYQIGWSDTKLAADNGVPAEWVKAIRERDFGGTGEDPTFALFVAQQLEVKREMSALSTALAMTSQKLEESTMWTTELARKMDGYRNTARRIIDRVEALEKIADRIETVPPRKAG
jgi:hypothetical protein